MNQSNHDIEQLVVWDKSSAMKRLMEDEALLTVLIDKFQKISLKLLPELAAAINADSLSDVEMLSHKLKGSASAIGAARVAIIAQEIESLAQKNTLVSNTDLIIRLKDEMELFFSTSKS